jgi:hypothetical protein
MIYSSNFKDFFLTNPTNTPEITNSIGKKIGPINKPKTVILDEYINESLKSHHLQRFEGSAQTHN